MHKAKGLTQAYGVQNLAYSGLMALQERFEDENGKLQVDKDGANAIAQLAKVWSDAQEAGEHRAPADG